MSIYIDTSAIVAILDAADPRNAVASRTWADLVARREEMVISSFTLVEASAVLQSRFGIAALRSFTEDMLPLMTIHWVEQGTYVAAAHAVLACARRQGPSLVDCTAFEIMRRHRIGDAFAYDPHFAAEGFSLIGQP